MNKKEKKIIKQPTEINFLLPRKKKKIAWKIQQQNPS